LRQITFLVSPGFELLDLSGPLCVFSIAAGIASVHFDIKVASMQGGGVATSSGLSLETEGPDCASHGDSLIAIGGPTAHVAGSQPDLVERLAALRPTTRTIASVCTGAFFLAEAGILHGRRATTHWRYAQLLRSRFPDITVEPDRIFVRDGDVWTSAGICAGIDLVLAMVEADLGVEVAKAAAREMVVYHRRLGGQSQFSVLLEMEPGSDRIRDVLTFARTHLREDLSVERMAEVARVSARQFARTFLRETGDTPARAVERLRAEAARPRIEDGTESIEIIARSVGFGDAERMRRTFVKLFGQPPQAMRRSARDADTAV
jgi:transcriptional regulator GlxA family with amidase domain